MTDELLTIADRAVKEALRQGADQADAIAVEGHSTEVGIRESSIEKLEQAEGKDISLRVFCGKSSATMSSSVMTGDAIKRLAERAVAVAKLAPPDPYAGLAEPNLLARKVPDLDLVSARLPSSDELERLARRAEAAALSVKGVSKSNGAGASASDRRFGHVMSNGFAKGYRRTGCGVSVSVIAGEGTAMQRDYDYSSAIHFGDLREPEEVGIEAGNRAVRRLNPRKVKSQSVPVVYDRRVASGLLNHFLGAINGASVARGASFLKERMGQAIFGDHITIVEDPLMPRGHGSRPFDGEGLACVKRNLIDRGVLTGWLLDLRSARQLGLSPTGHGGRNGPSSSNVHLEPGACSPEELWKDIKQGLLITELIGTGANMVTGDYSRGASGYWIENGGPAFPVSEITIAGNLGDMFRTLTPADDLEFRASTNAPSCLVEGMTLAGI